MPRVAGAIGYLQKRKLSYIVTGPKQEIAAQSRNLIGRPNYSNLQLRNFLRLSLTYNSMDQIGQSRRQLRAQKIFISQWEERCLNIFASNSNLSHGPLAGVTHSLSPLSSWLAGVAGARGVMNFETAPM